MSETASGITRLKPPMVDKEVIWWGSIRESCRPVDNNYSIVLPQIQLEYRWTSANRVLPSAWSLHGSGVSAQSFSNGIEIVRHDGSSFVPLLVWEGGISLLICPKAAACGPELAQVQVVDSELEEEGAKSLGILESIPSAQYKVIPNKAPQNISGEKVLTRLGVYWIVLNGEMMIYMMGSIQTERDPKWRTWVTRASRF